MDVTKVKYLNLFATPILSEAWSDSEAFNGELRRLILEHRSAESGVMLSNVLGWQSRADMLAWGGQPAERLQSRIVARCDEVTLDLRQKDQRIFRWVAHMWANVSQSGASNQTHSHPGAYWSAVYYVDDGYAGSVSKELGGELVFLDPRMPFIRAGMPDLRCRRPAGEIDHHESWLRPSSGLLIIFPSWLMHSVRPYRGTGQRISIAVNLWPRPLSAENAAGTADGRY